MKRCSRCGEYKSPECFSNNRSRPDGLSNWCKTCNAEDQRNRQRANKEVHYARAKAWREKNPDHVLNKSLLWRHGITLDQYNALLQEQGGTCKIRGCNNTPADQGDKRLAIDHDHSCCPGKRSCGKCVIGLLCSLCNTGLGAFQDSIELLEAALEYRREYEAQKSSTMVA